MMKLIYKELSMLGRTWVSGSYDPRFFYSPLAKMALIQTERGLKPHPMEYQHHLLPSFQYSICCTISLIISSGSDTADLKICASGFPFAPKVTKLFDGKKEKNSRQGL